MLQTDWASVLPPERCSYVLGNPPFIGDTQRPAEQNADLELVCHDIHGAGVLDFVAAWYIKAARYMAVIASEAWQSITNTSGLLRHDVPRNDGIRCAFVSTNSITQGEQVGVLWSWMLAQGIKIHFAHRTFSWNNEARGKAAVHCVIVGFGLQDISNKTIYEYDDIKGEPHAVKVGNINPYLVDAPDAVLQKRSFPICTVPEIRKGSQPTDGGNLLLSAEEKDALISTEPLAAQWIRPFLGADEFINAIPRYCLWLVDCPPQELRRMRLILARVNKVKAMRLESKKTATRDLANSPTIFGELRQPKTDYLIVQEVSSERRFYLPIGYMRSSLVPSNKVYTLTNASLYHLGILSSPLHMVWTRAVTGRMKSDYQYSAGIVYNNFPWPVIASDAVARQSTDGTTGLPRDDVPRNDKQIAAIEAAAQDVLDARAAHPQASLADLYDPLTMPANLLKAHQLLDKFVDNAYGYKGANTVAVRVAFLFERYQAITSLLPAVAKARKTRK